MFRLFLLAAPAICALAATLPPPHGCEVPKNMKKEQKAPCVRQAGFMLEQPSLTAVQLTNGPDFDAAKPDQTRFAWFAETDEVRCYFRPHYAFKHIKGESLKFQCWHMTPDGAFFGRKGDPIRVDDVKVVIRPGDGGEKRASLYPGNDANNEHEIKADRVKVKYLKPPHPNHNPRYNEVFTEIAASRIMWVLGFPADHVYPAGSSTCIGCTADPFGDNLTDNKASLKDSPVTFKIVSAERELDWDPIDPEGDETWSWSDAARLYANGGWTHDQKVAYDAYRLALGLFFYHNGIDIQNRLACAEWEAETPGQPRVCRKPMIFVQDLGSTFGKAKGPLDIFGTNPRGSFSDWQPQTVFRNPAACELRATLGGDKQVLKEAQDIIIQRSARLDRDTVKSIFRTARFQLMDQKQLSRLRGAGTKDVEDAALNEWTDVFLKRIEEIRGARNCKAN